MYYKRLRRTAYGYVLYITEQLKVFHSKLFPIKHNYMCKKSQFLHHTFFRTVLRDSDDGEGCSNPVEEPKFRRGRGRPTKVRGSGGRGRPQKQIQKIKNPPKRNRIKKRCIDETVAVIQERKQVIKRRIDELSPEEMKNTLLKVVDENPEYLFSILEPCPGPSQHPPETTQLIWCSCGFCRDMPTQKEKLCCQRNANSCVSRLPDFDVLILNEAVLALARLYRQDILAMPEDTDRNRANRHTAYRQFVFWHHGKLGTGNRRVIPSCCIWRIRDRFPDPHGQYVGFKDELLEF